MEFYNIYISTSRLGNFVRICIITTSIKNNCIHSQEKNCVAKKKYDYVFAPPILPPLLGTNLTSSTPQDAAANVQTNKKNEKNNFGTQTFCVE